MCEKQSQEYLGPVHTTSEEFQNGGFTLKMNLKTQKLLVVLDLCAGKI